ncbi:hypothetical protein MC885_016331 [Smutsia gigantea]|nr:hypothetical protein MC885_016331 [Smutsia gigantea]
MLGIAGPELWQQRGRRGALVRRVLAYAQLPGARIRPLEAELVHERLAALARALAEGAAGRQSLLQHCAHGRVHRAQKKLELCRALHLHQWVELVYLQARILLVRVAQQVGHDGLVVRDVRAQRDGDGLAVAVVRDGDAPLAVVLLPALLLLRRRRRGLLARSGTLARRLRPDPQQQRPSARSRLGGGCGGRPRPRSPPPVVQRGAPRHKVPSSRRRRRPGSS